MPCGSQDRTQDGSNGTKTHWLGSCVLQVVTWPLESSSTMSAKIALNTQQLQSCIYIFPFFLYDTIFATPVAGKVSGVS